MNQPLNPVIKTPIAPPAPGNEKYSRGATPTSPGRQAPRELARLSMPESHALITWLMAYKMQPGDTLTTLATSAATALNNPRINKNHVQQRMEEFGLDLPKRQSNAPVIERLVKLETSLTLLINEQLRICRMARIDPAPALVAVAKELDLM
jgi:hypothetical protein